MLRTVSDAFWIARPIASSTPVSLLPTISLSRYTWLLIGVLPIGQPFCFGGSTVSAAILLHSGGSRGRSGRDAPKAGSRHGSAGADQPARVSRRGSAAAGAVVGVDLARPALAGISPVGQAPLLDPAQDPVEVGFVDEERVVPRVH